MAKACDPKTVDKQTTMGDVGVAWEAGPQHLVILKKGQSVQTFAAVRMTRAQMWRLYTFLSALCRD